MPLNPLQELQEKTREENSRKMDDVTFNELFEADELGLLLIDGGIDLTPEQLKKVKLRAKELSQEKLEEMAYKVSSQPGYKEFMTLPLLSSVLKDYKKSTEEKEKKEEKSLYDSLNSNKKSEKKPEEKPQEKPQEKQKPATQAQLKPKDNTKVKQQKDPERTKIGPGSNSHIRVGDSESDLLSKLFLFMEKTEKWNKNKEKDDEKYRKLFNAQKDRFLDETVYVLTGEKAVVTGKIKKRPKKKGFLKTALKAAIGVGGLLVAKDALANINWDKKFSDIFKDLKLPDLGTIEGIEGAAGGEKAGDWKKDTEFLNKVNEYSKQKGIKASDLLAVMASESGLDASKVNPKSGATGLIQFTKDTAKELGTSTEQLAKMSRSDQFEYVKKYLEKGGLKQGATGGDIYAQVYLPARKDRDVLAKKGEEYYQANIGLDVGEKGYITKKDLQARTESKKKEFDIQDVPVQTASTRSLAKISNVTSGFGQREIAGKVEQHGGLDLPGKTGDVVEAPAAGQVVFAGWENPNDHKQGFGQYIRIRHADGTESIYGHLSKINVNTGDSIQPEQKIGEVGSTGRSTGPHLHYEIRKDGKKVDPRKVSGLDLNPVVPDYKLASADQTFRETQGLKKSDRNPALTIISNGTNIINGGDTTQVIQQQADNHSEAVKQFLGIN